MRMEEPEKLKMTPLIDIAFLVLIFFMALPLKTLAFKMEAQLPKEGIEGFPTDVQPPPKVILRLRTRADGTRFELGDHYSHDLGSLRPVVRRLGIDVIYEIHADSTVPWNDIVKVYDVLAEVQKLEGAVRTRFRGTALPSRLIRQAIPLPPPR
ncbi:MAG: biopolymer transporter ExbD [Planctomycetota bacterium]|nr:biopolymer transporter ExbD [Planctomycetota bacterium]